MPAWVAAGFNEYNKRLPRELHLNLVEIPPVVRTKSATTKKNLTEEARRIQAAIPDNALVIALDEHGVQFDSDTLSRKIETWSRQGQSLAFIIGGADGLAPSLRDKATIAFGAATWPHQLVRIMLMEQIYRAVTILSGHPYHRS